MEGDILTAASWAAKLHSDQRRKGSRAEPYIGHLLEVACLLSNVGQVRDPSTLVAALLHDAVEDGHTTLGHISIKFGVDVRDIVAELTDPSGLTEQDRRRRQIDHASQLSIAAKQIKLADKTSNIREIGEQPPDDWTDAKVAEYIDWGRRVVENLRGTNSCLEEAFDRVVADALESIQTGVADSPSTQCSPSA